MSKFHSYREGSRINWGRTLPDGEALNLEQIQAGAVLRIADATEAMAKNHVQLIKERDEFEREAKYWRGQCESERRTCSTLRGQITRLRKVAARWMFWRQHYKALTTMEVAGKTGINLFWQSVTSPEQMDKVTDEAINQGVNHVGK